ncbi:putative reverse transcriptase domain-containing protein [Tanacetum coccineum]
MPILFSLRLPPKNPTIISKLQNAFFTAFLGIVKIVITHQVASVGRGMKDLHVFVDSKFLVDQVEGNRVPRTEGAKRYREEIMDATAPFHRFRITYLPKALNPKAETLTGLASIRLEFLNQEVSVGVKTRPSVEAQDKLPEKARNVSKKTASGKSIPTWEDRKGNN